MSADGAWVFPIGDESGKFWRELLCTQCSEDADGGAVPCRVVAGFEDLFCLIKGARIAHGGEGGEGGDRLLREVWLGGVLDGVGIAVAQAVLPEEFGDAELAMEVLLLGDARLEGARRRGRADVEQRLDRRVARFRFIVVEKFCERLDEALVRRAPADNASDAREKVPLVAVQRQGGEPRHECRGVGVRQLAGGLDFRLAAESGGDLFPGTALDLSGSSGGVHARAISVGSP